MDPGRPTDEDLLTSWAADRTGAAFGTFYRRHERLVAAYHLRRVRDPELAADLTAETFAQALAARPRFKDRGPGAATAWLYAIASNVRSNAARTAAVESRKVEALGLARHTLTDDQRDELALLATEAGALGALDALEPRQRAAVRAYVLEDQPYPVIAAAEGTSESTIRKRVSRGLAAIRRDIKETP